jgi:hypothetical protein
MNVRMILFLLLTSLSALAQNNPRNTIHVSIGRLTTDLLGPLLKNFSADQVQNLAQIAEAEKKGKKKGMKYKVTLSGVRMSGLFQNLSADQYTIAVGSNGVIVVDCNMPDAQISGRIDLRARPQDAGIFGAFDPFGVVDAVAEDLGKVDRTYRVSATGIRFSSTIQVRVDGEGITVLKSNLTDLRIGKTRVDLRSERDAIGARFANIFSFGSIDDMIKDMILDQLQGRRVAERMAGPINAMVANGLRVPITHSLDVSPDIQFGSGRELDANEMRVVVPFAFIEKFAENLKEQQMFTFSGEQSGVKFDLSVTGRINATAGNNNEILWQVPIEVTAAASKFLKNAAIFQATVSLRTRPSVDEERGLVIEIAGASVSNIQNWPLPFGRGAAEKAMSSTLVSRLKEVFPAGEMMVTPLPIMENIDWRVGEVRVEENGVVITGALSANEKPADTRTSNPTVSESRASCRIPVLGLRSNNRRVIIFHRRRG